MLRIGIKAAALVAIPLLLVGCSGKTAVTDKTQDDGVKAGAGVTKDTIRVGALDDLSGPFATNGKEMVIGRQIYFDQRNADGGICDRQVEVVSRDAGYSPEKAKTQYAEIRNEVVAFQEILGSPLVAAISSELKADSMVVIAGSNASSLLGNPLIVVPGSTYGGELANVVDYVAAENDLAEGDTIGVIYLQGEYGEDGLAGAKAAADNLGMKVAEQSAQVTDRDMTAQVTALKGAGVKAIFVAGSPAMFNSAISIAQAQRLDVPFGGNNPTYSVDSLKTAAAPALEKRAVYGSSLAPMSSDVSAEILKAYRKGGRSGTPGLNVNYGYAMAAILGSALDKACETKDLTRSGVAKAVVDLKNVDASGVLVPVNYTRAGKSPSLESFIVAPDSSIDGGLKVVAEPTAGEGAKALDAQ